MIYIEIEIFRVDLNIHNSVGEGSFFPRFLSIENLSDFAPDTSKSSHKSRMRSANLCHRSMHKELEIDDYQRRIQVLTGENKSYVIGGVGGGRQRSGNISHQACVASDAI
jgi:hypothetical protein